MSSSDLNQKQTRQILKRRRQQRAFEAAKASRLQNSWIITAADINSEIRQDLESLRARSRDLARNDSIAKSYFRILKNNVVGKVGIQPRPIARNSQNKLDSNGNKRLKRYFGFWAKRVTPTGLSWMRTQRMVLDYVARDGEALIQFLRGRKYPMGLSLKLIEPDFMDIEFNTDLQNGNVVRSGIEVDEDGVVQAYHVWRYHPLDQSGLHRRANARLRIPAEDLLHVYDPERASQLRGYPWLHSVMADLKQLKEYQFSELVSARVASAKMGFLTRNLEASEAEYSGDEDEDDDDAYSREVEPGVVELLPPGYDFKGFDPQSPNANFKEFSKAVLQKIAASMGISYNSLVSDLEGVNYSSMRQGALQERDMFMNMQSWMAETFCEPVYLEWLKMGMLTGALPFEFSEEKLQKFSAVEWKARRWQWVDPAKELDAIQKSLDNNLDSKINIVAQQGRDYEEILMELQEQRELEARYGVSTDVTQIEEEPDANT